MHPIVYYIIVFLGIGAGGMAVANRKVSLQVRQTRWLKYFTYIIFTGIVIIGIFYNFFTWLAWLISIMSMVELLKVNLSKPPKPFSYVISSQLFLLIMATGFILFSLSFQNSFLLFIYFQVLVFDGFCQIMGQLFGKHALVPAISPTKTWEGLAGGWGCCVIAAMLAANWISIPVSTSVVFGVLTGATSFIGDILASYYKRLTGIKDYSNWLPGQGGFLDRFDSLLCSAAIYYLLYITTFKQGFDSFVKE